MDEIDITPWLPLLCDGASHNFTLAVAGISDNGDLSDLKGTVTPGVGSFWVCLPFVHPKSPMLTETLVTLR